MAYKFLSMADLMLIPEFPEAYGKSEEDDSALKSILYECGIDVEKEYDWHYCTHRRMNNEVVTCPRVEGKERIDREWLESGMASYDSRIDSYEDISFRQELRKMMHISTVDRAFDKNNDY